MAQYLSKHTYTVYVRYASRHWHIFHVGIIIEHYTWIDKCVSNKAFPPKLTGTPEKKYATVIFKITFSPGDWELGWRSCFYFRRKTHWPFFPRLPVKRPIKKVVLDHVTGIRLVMRQHYTNLCKSMSLSASLIAHPNQVRKHATENLNNQYSFSTASHE